MGHDFMMTLWAFAPLIMGHDFMMTLWAFAPLIAFVVIAIGWIAVERWMQR